MSNWLRTDSPAQPVNTATLRGLLSQLDAVFSATAAQRKAIDKAFGTDYSPPRKQALANLKEAADQQIGQLREQIAQAFTAAKQQAHASRVRAGQDFHASAQGAQYLQSLAAFTAMAQHLDAKGLAARINESLDNGLVPMARAWAELARLNPPANPGGALYLALDRAAAEALTPSELAATLEGEYLATAERRFALFDANQSDSRLRYAIESGEDTHAVGNVGPVNVFGEADIATGGE